MARLQVAAMDEILASGAAREVRLARSNCEPIVVGCTLARHRNADAPDVLGFDGGVGGRNRKTTTADGTRILEGTIRAARRRVAHRAPDAEDA